jgi:hypothetical protein
MTAYHPHPKYDSDFENHILARMLRHPELFNRYCRILDAQYFTSEAARTSARTLLRYRQKYGHFPNKIAFVTGMARAHERSPITIPPAKFAEHVDQIFCIEIGDRPLDEGQLFRFVLDRAISDAFARVVANINGEESWDTSGLAHLDTAIFVRQSLMRRGATFRQVHGEVFRGVAPVTPTLKSGSPSLDDLAAIGWSAAPLCIPDDCPRKLSLAPGSMPVDNPLVALSVMYFPIEMLTAIGLPEVEIDAFMMDDGMRLPGLGRCVSSA